MKKSELIDFFEYANKWREGADIPMPQPRDLTIAIKASIRLLREGISDYDAERILKDYNFNHFNDERI